MKIKILLAPSLIVIIIVMIIWYIYPAYTNGIDGIKERSKQLTDQQKLMDNLDNRIGNVGRLAASLKAGSSDNDLVYSYIPQKDEEEKIIENLNSLAKDSALAVLNISVTEDKTTPVQEVSAPAPSDPFSAPDADAAIPVVVTPQAVPKNLKVGFSVVGDYANIKILLQKIEKLKRFNDLEELEIKTLLKEDQSVGDSLQADITLQFNYLSDLKRLSVGDINNIVFSAGVFDVSVADKIRNSCNIEVSEVIPGEKGGNNPFIMAK